MAHRDNGSLLSRLSDQCILSRSLCHHTFFPCSRELAFPSDQALLPRRPSAAFNHLLATFCNSPNERRKRERRDKKFHVQCYSAFFIPPPPNFLFFGKQQWILGTIPRCSQGAPKISPSRANATLPPKAYKTAFNCMFFSKLKNQITSHILSMVSIFDVESLA